MDQLLKLIEQNAKLTTDQLSALLGKTEEEINSAIKEYEKEKQIKAKKEAAKAAEAKKEREHGTEVK